MATQEQASSAGVSFKDTKLTEKAKASTAISQLKDTTRLYHSLVSLVKFVETLDDCSFSTVRKEALVASIDHSIASSTSSDDGQPAVYNSAMMVNDLCSNMLLGFNGLRRALQGAISTLAKMTPYLSSTTAPDTKLDVADPEEDSSLTRYLMKLLAVKTVIIGYQSSMITAAFKEVLVLHAVAEEGTQLSQNTLEFSSERIKRINDSFAMLNATINSGFKKVVYIIAKFLLMLPGSADKSAALKSLDLYFGTTITDTFDKISLAKNPKGYMDSFVPPAVASQPSNEYGWRTFLYIYGPPLLKYFLEHEIPDVHDWEEAKDRIEKAFKYTRLTILDDAVYIFSGFFNCNSLVRLVHSSYSMSTFSLPFLAAVTTDKQQKVFVDGLLKNHINVISSYNFYDLEGLLATTA